ncbi:MAG: hypothetical protein KAI18_02705 [Candidatus Aenigmarchaeota archaeon]|nr:hypothetical protein [Candidatus Aenigmarchaeota archaeon]
MDIEQINSMITEYLEPIDREIKGWIGIKEEVDDNKSDPTESVYILELASLDEHPPLFSGYAYLVPITKTDGDLEIGKILRLKTPLTATEEAKYIEKAQFN